VFIKKAQKASAAAAHFLMTYTSAKTFMKKFLKKYDNEHSMANLTASNKTSKTIIN
jgi:hypothetical protein